MKVLFLKLVNDFLENRTFPDELKEISLFPSRSVVKQAGMHPSFGQSLLLLAHPKPSGYSRRLREKLKADRRFGLRQHIFRPGYFLPTWARCSTKRMRKTSMLTYCNRFLTGPGPPWSLVNSKNGLSQATCLLLVKNFLTQSHPTNIPSADWRHSIG